MATKLTSSYQYIGRSSPVSCDAGFNYYIVLYAKTAGDVSTGKHQVSVQMYLASPDDTSFYGYYTNGSVSVAGTSAFSWSNQQNPNKAWSSEAFTAEGITYKRWVLLREGSVTVNTGYGVDKDVGISTSWNRCDISGSRPSWLPYTTNIGGSVTVTLPMIASASVPNVSAGSVVMKETVTIYTNRSSSSLTHDLTYSFGGSTGTIGTGVGESCKWTVPDLVSKIPGKRSGTCTITCNTKSGSTVIGTKTVTLTLTIPAQSTPSASASTVQMGTSVDIYTNRKSSAYIHKLTYKVGSNSGTIDTGVEGGRKWTPPKNLASYTGNETSAVCTIKCETYNGSLVVGTSTTQIILTVPDATVPTLSANSIVLGKPITINTPREVSCYEHWFTYTLKAEGSSTVVFSKAFEGPIQTSYEWTPSLALLAPKIPSATNGTITLTCETRFKDSSTVVGTSDPISFSITVPDNSTTKPKVTMTATAVDTPLSGVYVAGKSKVKVSYTASSDYSTIESYYTELLNAKSSANPYTSAVLANAGTVAIIGKVTDARGYVTTKNASIEVIDYRRPRITPGEGKSSIVCTRCNSGGTVDPGGVYLLIQIGRKYSKVVSNGTQKNFCKLSYQWKTDAQDDSAYSDPVVLLARTATSDYVSKTLSGIVTSNTTAYNIRLIAEDDVGETDTVTITVPTAFVTFHAPVGGHGFSLGGYHDPSKVDVFDCRFAAEFQGNVSGRVLGLGALPEIPENADINDYKEFGSFAVRKTLTAATLNNCPSEKAGTLRVWSSNGAGKTSEDYAYIIQEYINYDNSGTWRRCIQIPSAGGVWQYGEWKCVADYADGVTGNWYWRKYSDGTAECWARVRNAARDVVTQFGSMYYANCDEVTFPFSFYSAPVVNATVESGTALILMSWQGTSGNGTATATKPASYRVVRPTTITGAAFTIAYHAIGRWK